MRLATSTCMFPNHRNAGRTSIIESMRLCRESGFEVIDLNFCSAINKNGQNELCQPDWEHQIDLIGEEAAKLGVTFNQSHPPYDSNLYRADRKMTEEERAWYFESVRRALYASAKLGANWCVIHAQSDVLNDEMGFEANLKTNLEFYSPLVEWAKQYGTGIAIENMAEFHPQKTRRRFTAVVEEQIAIIDALNDPAVGACWDFGHAELVYRDQSAPLRKLGHRLRVTHVQENRGDSDDHFLPFIRGNTNWEVLMPLLKEIGYTGDFTYEVHGFFAQIPDALRVKAGKFAYEIGQYLISLYDNAAV